MIKAACNCSAVAFEISGAVHGIYMCHCSICRRATGAAAVPILIARNEDFRWIKGEEHIKRWEKPGHDWAWAFCGTCGSPLPTPNDAETMAVQAGLVLTGHEHMEVSDHIFTQSKAHWDVIGDAALQHPGEFGFAPDKTK